MNWIKASEKTPTEYEDVYIKFKGFRYVGYFEPIYKTFRQDGHQLFTQDNFDDVFWLDET